MAGPIIHLLAAKEWAGGRPDLIACPEFYLGAVAPDAIHVRPGTDITDKRRTHLNNHGRLNMKPMAEYARARKAPFDLGYLTHLLIDPFWCAAYVDIPGLRGANGRTNPEIYYREMNRCENALVDEELFALVERAVPPADHPLLTAEEISEWRRRVLSHPRGTAAEAGENRCITMAFVTAFIVRAGAYIDDMMGRLSQ